MLAKYKGHIIATVAVLFVMLVFAFIGAMLDFKHAGGLAVQVPMFFLVVAVWGYVYNAFKPGGGRSVSVLQSPSVVPGPTSACEGEVQKYLHLSVLLNAVLAALLLASLLRVMSMQKTIQKLELVPGTYTFMYMGEKKTANVDKVGQALAMGAVLIGQTTRAEEEELRASKRR